MKRKDETGNRYGRLVVIKFVSVDKARKAMWKCLCDCGNETEVVGANLRSGLSKSCGCLGPNHFIDETNNIYEHLTVIEFAGKDKHGQIIWKCLCDCGNETIVLGRHLRNGNTRSCGCLRIQYSTGVAAMRVLIRRYKHAAQRRNLDWELTEEQFHELTSVSCHYCGVEPKQKYSQSALNGDYTYNGLDRVDNTQGYTLDNVVSCCKTCNYAKRGMSLTNFLEWAKRLYQHSCK